MDIEGFEALLRGLEGGTIRVIARDLTEPSPLALEVLNARPYAYLDDAPLEERRTQAVMSRRWLDPESAADIGKLDPEAIQRVRDEAWPDATNADELHDALSWLTFLTDAEVQRQPGWPDLIDTLGKQRRVTRSSTTVSARDGRPAPHPMGLRRAPPRIPRPLPHASLHPHVDVPATYDKQWTDEEALVEVIRGRLQGIGPPVRRHHRLSRPAPDID